jgi:hypothetical protein
LLFKNGHGVLKKFVARLKCHVNGLVLKEAWGFGKVQLGHYG